MPCRTSPEPEPQPEPAGAEELGVVDEVRRCGWCGRMSVPPARQREGVHVTPPRALPLALVRMRAAKGRRQRAQLRSSASLNRMAS